MAQTSSTAAKALELLTLMGDHPHGATAGQLVEQAGHPFSTVYRLLSTLVDADFLAFDPRDKRYRLGLRVYQLGQRVSAARGFEGTALPVLRRLTETTGESSLLAVLDGNRFLTVHKVDGPQFRITTDPGDHGSLHTSALGKALLAFAPPETAEDLIGTIELIPRTERSVTDREQLRRQVEQVRARGWAGQSEEHDPGMAALAVPVLTTSGRLIAAVALAAPVFRTTGEGLQQFLPELRQAAEALAMQLPQRP